MTPPAQRHRRPDPAALLRELARVLPKGALIAPSGSITTYERDGHASDAGDPLAIVLPETTGQVRQAMRIASAAGIPVMPRGAGTSRCGGAIPLAGSLVIGTSRMKSVLAFDPQRGCIRVQPGVTNLAISEHVGPAGWFYAPDPSSRRTCTVGGNIATNSSGACALRHGVTAHQVLGLTAVLHDGDVIELGEHAGVPSSYDLAGFLCGSEGQLALLTEATLRLEPLPEHSETLVAGFPSRDQALAAVSRILRSGLLPFRLEFMDRRAVALTEKVVPSGYPLDAEAILLVELHGFRAELAADLQALQALVRSQGACSVRQVDTASEADHPWAGREAIYRAASRSGGFEALDCCVPLARLGEALTRIETIAATHAVEHATVAHAGDGTLHAFLLHAAGDSASTRRALACGDAIRAACAALGGSISAEYGVGLGRRGLLGLQFSALDLQQQRRTRAAWAPDDWMNPGKVFDASLPQACLELPA